MLSQAQIRQKHLERKVKSQSMIGAQGNMLFRKYIQETPVEKALEREDPNDQRMCSSETRPLSHTTKQQLNIRMDLGKTLKRFFSTKQTNRD